MDRTPITWKPYIAGVYQHTRFGFGRHRSVRSAYLRWKANEGRWAAHIRAARPDLLWTIGNTKFYKEDWNAR